jgi:hypothetical protein
LFRDCLAKADFTRKRPLDLHNIFYAWVEPAYTSMAAEDLILWRVDDSHQR